MARAILLGLAYFSVGEALWADYVNLTCEHVSTRKKKGLVSGN